MKYRTLDDGSIELFGYCNITNRDSKVLSEKGIKFKEQIIRGTWQRAIDKNSDIKLLKNHSWEKVYDSTAEGLTLYEDRIGARFSIRTNNEELKQLAINEEFKGLSFAFKCNQDEFEDIGNGLKRRYIRDMDVFEISLLTIEPAYDGSIVEMRDSDGNPLEIRYLEPMSKKIDEAEITDLSTNTYEENNDNTDIPNDDEEVRVFDYTILEKQLEFLKLKNQQ